LPCVVVPSRYLVEDGSMVTAGQPFAEVEVMKMYMTLRVPEAGKIYLTKLEGSMLEPGELIATVSLSDPTKVHKVCCVNVVGILCSRGVLCGCGVLSSCRVL
jgi:hypothetical protein